MLKAIQEITYCMIKIISKLYWFKLHVYIGCFNLCTYKATLCLLIKMF